MLQNHHQVIALLPYIVQIHVLCTVVFPQIPSLSLSVFPEIPSLSLSVVQTSFYRTGKFENYKPQIYEIVLENA